MRKSLLLIFGLVVFILCVGAAPTMKLGAWIPTVNSYTKHVDVQSGSATFGTTVPSSIVFGTYGGLGWNDGNDEAHLSWEVPDDWNGTTDCEFRIYWVNDPGTVIPDTKKVIWKINYRGTATNGDIDTGTAATASSVYTQAGGGTDGTMHVSSLTLVRADVNQPIIVDRVYGFQILRDIATEGGDTYSGNAVILRFEVGYTSTGITNH